MNNKDKFVIIKEILKKVRLFKYRLIKIQIEHQMSSFQKP